MSLFQLKHFKSHSGLDLDWKIECDSLTNEDIETLAYIGSRMIDEYSEVVGIPDGGIRFAKALEKYKSNTGKTLIVDDVLTTGNSMNTYKIDNSIGMVMYARGEYPEWITPIFKLSKMRIK